MCIQSKWGLAAAYLLNVSETQLLIPVFAGQAEATRDSLWWFFFPNPQFAFGEKGMCLCIFFVSWLLDLCSCLDIWFLNALSVCLSLSGMSQRLQMFRVSFPVCLHICAWAWALSVCSHILLCQSKRGFQVFIYPTVPLSSLAGPAQNCGLLCQGHLRLELGICVKAALPHQSMLPPT